MKFLSCRCDSCVVAACPRIEELFRKKLFKSSSREVDRIYSNNYLLLVTPVRTKIYGKEEFALRRCTGRDHTTCTEFSLPSFAVEKQILAAGTVEESSRRATVGITDLFREAGYRERRLFW